MSALVMHSGDSGVSIRQESRGGALCEGRLPAPVREALRLAREARPQQTLQCLAFHTAENGREIARLGLTSMAGLRPKDVMVLAVAVTETGREDVRTLSHTLVIRVEAAR